MRDLRPIILLIGTLLVAGCSATAPTKHPKLRYELVHHLLIGDKHSLVLVPRRDLRYSLDVMPGTFSMSPAAAAIAQADFLTAAQGYCVAGEPFLDGKLEMPWGSRSSDRIESGQIVGTASLTGLLQISGVFACR